ncbi:MAG: guanylate kinase [Omnitrophica WOR_2 bacterium RBG_13_44_8b]|nr:MAG: guanylate kinase [Omnitrophica WOR_2 bacterium RBG_13_44_8b]
MIFVISGPSGSGKTSLRDKLLEDQDLKSQLVKSISLTTRAMRPGENNKKDYFFVTEAEFKRKLKAEKILEWTKYLGYYYATPKDSLDKQLRRGAHIVLCLDLKGALRVKRLYHKHAATIFILPPSLKALRDRIQGRCPKTEKTEIDKRIKLARKELQACGDYDYCIENINMQQAVKELKQIVLQEIDKPILAR